MEINLNEKISDHLSRIESLAEEAEADRDESFSSRAAAMTALTNIIKELTKSQETVYNMERLQKIEQATIRALKECLTDAEHEQFLENLEELLNG